MHKTNRIVGYSNGVDNNPMYSFIINMAQKDNLGQEINAYWSLVVSNLRPAVEKLQLLGPASLDWRATG